MDIHKSTSLVVDLSDSFFLGINATTASLEGDTGFAGVALYPQFPLVTVLQ